MLQPLFEVFPTLQVGELCQLSMRQLQDSFKLIMDVSSRRCRLKTVRFPQVCNIRFCHARRTRAISRTQTELLQPVSGEEDKIHGVLYSVFDHTFVPVSSTAHLFSYPVIETLKTIWS